MCRAQFVERDLRLFGQREQRLTPIELGRAPHDQSQSLQTIHQTRRAVRFEEQSFGKITDRRLARWGGADCEQRLMLLGGQPPLPCLAFTESHEPAQRIAEIRQGHIVGLGQ